MQAPSLGRPAKTVGAALPKLDLRLARPPAHQHLGLDEGAEGLRRRKLGQPDPQPEGVLPAWKLVDAFVRYGTGEGLHP
jgi:hypothetical protein